MQYGGHEGQKIRPKPPGPFGPAKPNYRCEKDKETLFVTKVDFTSDQKCFTVFSVDCFESYDTGKVSPCYLICYHVTNIMLCPMSRISGTGRSAMSSRRRSAAPCTTPRARRSAGWCTASSAPWCTRPSPTSSTSRSAPLATSSSATGTATTRHARR